MNFIEEKLQIPTKWIVLIVLLSVLFLPPLMTLITIWNSDDDYSHGFFVIPIFAYMVWQKKDILKSLDEATSWSGLIFLVFSLSVYFVAINIKFHTLVYISIVAVILSSVQYISGWEFSKRLFFPVLFLLFMFPIPSSVYIQITNPLKLMITDISAFIISQLGIPVFKEGNLLFFATTQLEVAEACSGIRSLFSYLMLSCLFSLYCSSPFKKIFIFLSAIPLALLVNIIRVTGTGILAHFFGEKAAQGFFHEFAGFLLFGVGLVFLFGIYYLIELIGKTEADSN